VVGLLRPIRWLAREERSAVLVRRGVGRLWVVKVHAELNSGAPRIRGIEFAAVAYEGMSIFYVSLIGIPGVSTAWSSA